MNFSPAFAKILAFVFLLPFLCMGFFLLHLAASRATDAWNLHEGALHAEGNIVDFDIRQSTGSSFSQSMRSKTCMVYYPVVSFRAAEGQRRFTSKLGKCETDYAKGDRVPVIYFADGQRGGPEIDHFRALWFGPILLGVMGALMVAGIGFLLFVMAKPAIVQAKQTKDTAG